MTKLSEKKETGNMHLHTTKKAFEVIDEYLPYQYVDEVQAICNKSASTIRNVRSSRKGNILVIKALLTVALKYKEEREELESLIN